MPRTKARAAERATAHRRATQGWTPSAYKDAVAVALLLVILFVRPTGLFAARVAYRP